MPHINTGGEAVRSGHNLDALLWATNETVADGNFDKTGAFRQH